MPKKRQVLKRSGSGESFFRFVQSHLHNECKGRLLALILRELGRQEPEAFLRFLRPVALEGRHVRDIKAGMAQFETERFYTPTRRADLAVLIDGREVLLVEVKEDDVAAPGNSAQLQDYLDYVFMQADPPHFIHLSRYSPLQSRSALDKVMSSGQVHDLRYRHLFEAVREYELSVKENTPLSRMVREYLEDIGVDSYNTVNLATERDALTFLVTQMAGFDDFHGLGRLHSASNVALVPDILRRLLGNAAVLGEWLYEANPKIMSQKPKHRFLVRSRYAPKHLAQAVKAIDPNDGLAEISRKAVQETSVFLFAGGMLQRASPQQWIYANIGFRVTVSAVEKEKARLALYAEIFWKRGAEDIYEESEDWLSEFPSESDATIELSKLLKSALKRAKKAPDYPATLDKFVVPVPRA